jgi:Uma2 family endonuclease
MSAGILMTPEEFDGVTDCDDSVNFELVNGVLVVTPMASLSERTPNDLLGYWINSYRYQHPEGHRIVETAFEQYLAVRGNRRRADRVIWVSFDDHRPDPNSDIPTIVVEFVSAGKAAWRRDYLEKRDEYLEAGVVEYWIVDRFRRSITVCVQSDGKSSERIIAAHEVYRTTLLPGFELRLAELLEKADQWSDDRGA